MIMEAWNSRPEQGDNPSYWRVDPGNEQGRWHVSYRQANTFGSVRGQVLESDGWYWWTADWSGQRFSSMFGPFVSAVAAMTDCLTAHKPEAREGRGVANVKQIQDPDRDMDKHWQAIVWMSGLVMDLHLRLLGHEPVRPIDEERLKEWGEHRKDLERCKERIEIKY